MRWLTRIRLGWVLAILAALSAIYVALLDPWFMNWGATVAEQRMTLPIDRVLPDSSHRFTRAITIQAPASVVWQWVVQIGQDRAGFYSNSWLENLTGANIHNANSIHAEWQRRVIGDHVRLARADLFASAETRIVALEPERSIAYIPCPFVLQTIDAGTTRLLIRESIPSTFAARTIGSLAWNPMHFVMEQRMLRGLKERAERRPLVPAPIVLISRIGWLFASSTLLALFLARSRFRAWALLPVALVLPILLLTADWDAAMAGFLAIGITVLGALVFGPRWWPPYLLIAAAVALILLLAPDPYAALGITLGAACLVAIAGSHRRLLNFNYSRRS